ncbi:MAG: hypothetical protein BM564_11685 [Bacteroidetes bacterium MedPE-SWsnd-G2]|nr:MAG: hypothetical protein BM564_11685 [Bacteroidetes bacterium MedPE-SWsnd-G2]
MSQPLFQIYNASAGSGKTFTLVKSYLKILLSSKSAFSFNKILALTFTNKAVGEMKSRIIESLMQFSSEDILTNPTPLFDNLKTELDVNAEFIHEKSKLLLETIMHNYASFDVSTIDKFNHSLIRTFALDLNLPVNFEVELDSQGLLSKAVDNLISQAGSNKELTKTLVDFAIEKADDNKSWDITLEFKAIANLLLKESDIPFLNSIKQKSLSDFSELRKALNQRINQLEEQIILNSDKAIDLLTQPPLEETDYTRKTLPNHFKNAKKRPSSALYSNKLGENLSNNTGIYKKSIDDDKKAIIDSILPEITALYTDTKALVFDFIFIKNALKNITPLSVLNAISKSLNTIKKEDDLLLISEFNSLISDEIKSQPAPFIYERIGEKFKHFFIDEFQDTSQLQWENLTPLIDNSITGVNDQNQTGSAMIVGDAKQAIYRWRGGKAEQFIKLYNGHIPFQIEKSSVSIKNLPTNYRSCKSIVTFNNQFFDWVSANSFSNETHSQIYAQAHQEIHLEEEGFVELSFLDIKNEDKTELYCLEVESTINKALENGFSYHDICIIVRKSKSGIAIAQHLNAVDIPIISSETLLLSNSKEVNFIDAILRQTTESENSELKLDVLNYIAEQQLPTDKHHDFIARLIPLDQNQMFNQLSELNIEFNWNLCLQLPLYESVEYIIRRFNLNNSSNAYIQFYLDEVLDFSQRSSSISEFLEYWDRKKDKLSIVAPEGDNAVQIMTIHKSKGLEFPIVIFPFANEKIDYEISPKTWFPVSPENYSGFNWLYLNYNKEIAQVNATGEQLHLERQSTLELDSINLLYVVLTRAVEQLYILTEFKPNKQNTLPEKTYQSLFFNYLNSNGLWSPEQMVYQFGIRARSLKAKQLKSNTLQKLLISVSRSAHNLNIITKSGVLWDTNQESAIAKGNLIHDIMAEIKTTADIENALGRFVNKGELSQEQAGLLSVKIKELILHPSLKSLYQIGLNSYNERDIITAEGQRLRPDRIVFLTDNEVSIIDYKTGKHNPIYEQQLQSYQDVLQKMGYVVKAKILVYINDDITVKEF